MTDEERAAFRAHMEAWYALREASSEELKKWMNPPFKPVEEPKPTDLSDLKQ